MALNTITPSNREEEYLSAIAGDEGATAPVPSNRREEWLRRIAEGQGDQTGRLDHIEDQLPIDPTSDDVGKVMTVVEDTSGEEPVYKWSAEKAKSGYKPVYHKYYPTNFPNPSFTSALKVTDIGSDTCDKIRTEIAALSGKDEIRRYFLDHFYFYANGQRMLQNSHNEGVNTSQSVDVTVPAVVSGVEKTIAIQFLYNYNATGNDLFTFGSARIVDGTNTQVSASDVTKSSNICLHFYIYMED